MEEKITAVYLMARQSELSPEDGGSYERVIENQKRKCLEFLRSRGIEESSRIAFYRSRSDLLKDVERDRIAWLVVHDIKRLGAFQAEIEGILFELGMRQIEVLTVEDKS